MGIFAAPSYSSPERTRIASLLIRVLLLLAFCFAVAGLASFGAPWVQGWQRAGTFLFAVVMLIGVRLVQAGKDRLIGWLLPVLVFGSAASSFVNDAHEAVFLGTGSVAIIIAGLVLPSRGAFGFGAACVVALLGGAYAHQEGLMVLARPPLGWGAYLAQATLLATATVLVGWANQGIRRMVDALESERSRLRHLNQELRLTKARHEGLLAQSFGGIVVLDEEMRVTYCNAIAVDLLGLPPDHDDLRLNDLPGFEAVTFDEADQRPGDEQLMYVGEGPTARPVSVRLGKTTLDEGQAAMLVLLQDLAQLEASERDRDRLRAQLHQSQKMEALGRLAAGLAHDFNNILMIVRTNTDLLLLDGDWDEEATESLQEIHDSSTRATDLTRQLLAFGRHSARRTEDVDLNHLIRDFLPMLKRMTHAGVEMTAETASEPVVVRVNPGEIQQVLANLVLNATDAMPEGGTATVAVSASGSDAVLTVTDTGEGMDDVTRAHLFEPFFTTKDVGAGTGLGLAMVHGIVTSSNGTLEVDSRVGAGTSIEMRFPAVEGPATWSPQSSRELELSRLDGAKVLVVDDEPAVREAMSRMITKAGGQVTSAGDGPSALRSIEDGDVRYDAAVIDVVMPGMSGPTLATKLRDRGCDAPIIFVSGHVPHAEEAGMSAASDLFLAKPVSPALLTKTIRANLARRPPAGDG